MSIQPISIIKRVEVKQYSSIMAVFTIAILACVAPGIFPQTSTLPTADSNAVLTMIVQTAQVLASQTYAAVTPSPTFIPATASSFPETPTVAPALPTLNASTLDDTSVTVLDGHLTRYTDNRAGFELTFPPGWLAVRINSPEYLEAWTRPEGGKPEFQTFLRKIQNQNGDVFRIFAIDTREDHLQHKFVTNINLVWDQQDNNSLEETLDQIKAQYPIISPCIVILNIVIQDDSLKSKYGLIESELRAKNELGKDFTIYQMQAITKIKTGTLILSLSTTTELKAIEKADFYLTIGSFQEILP